MRRPLVAIFSGSPLIAHGFYVVARSGFARFFRFYGMAFSIFRQS
jgi:hypothetical protein